MYKMSSDGKKVSKLMTTLAAGNAIGTQVTVRQTVSALGAQDNFFKGLEEEIISDHGRRVSNISTNSFHPPPFKQWSLILLPMSVGCTWWLLKRMGWKCQNSRARSQTTLQLQPHSLRAASLTLWDSHAVLWRDSRCEEPRPLPTARANHLESGYGDPGWYPERSLMSLWARTT